MIHAARSLLIGLLAAAALAVSAAAQPVAGPSYSQDELDQLLAPIALYPDQLLAQVLIAATYPLEVVEAARFVQQNPGLGGDALDQALADKNWDPSVQSLAAFPQVLAMMDDRLEWTQRLGDAFLADQQRVMDTVQSLRKRAEAAGNHYDKQSRVDQDGEFKATLLIGEKDWPFPFPLVKEGGRWCFDAVSGADQVLNRRIGRNELAAIQVCLAYVDAQREYAATEG